MSDRKTEIIGLKRTIRGGARDGRDLKEQNARWRKVCSMLRALAERAPKARFGSGFPQQASPVSSITR
jgi:hypothetical protein